MSQVFISYRRDGGEFLGKMIYDALTDRGYDVFYDVESLNPGKFNQQLLDKIEECPDFLLILTPGALDRCSRPEDWVRREVTHAMQTKRNLIPIKARNFQWPANLPAPLDQLRNYEAVSASHEFFDAAMDKLCTRFLKSRSSKPPAGEMPLELESREYYRIKLPLIQYYRRDDNDLSYIALRAIVAECVSEKRGWVPPAKDTLKDYLAFLSRMYWNIPLPSDAAFQKIEALRNKVHGLRENQTDYDLYFLGYFMICLFGTCAMMERHLSDYEGLTHICHVIACYLSDLPQDELKHIQAEFRKVSRRYFNHLPIPLVHWTDMMQKREGTPDERKTFTKRAILYMDAIVDAAVLWSELADYARDPKHFIAELRVQILCCYKHLKKHKIYLPKELQRKIYEF